MNTWLNTTWLRVLAILGLVTAAFAADLLPYAYFQLLNWVVAGASVAIACQAYTAKKAFILWLFMIVAVVFNPLAPLYFRQDVWRVADLVAALIFAATFFFGRAKPSSKKR